MNILEKIKASILQVIVGKEDVVDQLLACVLAGGHILLEDLPGTGKTVMMTTNVYEMRR